MTFDRGLNGWLGPHILPLTPTHPSHLPRSAPSLLSRFLAQTGFMANQSKSQLEGHVDSKHPKNKFEECFPGIEG